jgi:hypothetical protein
MKYIFGRVLSGGEPQTMQSTGYSVGDIVYQDKGMPGLWWSGNTGFEIADNDIELVDLDNLPRKWYIFLIRNAVFPNQEMLDDFGKIYSEVLEFKPINATIIEFHMVASKFSNYQIKRLVEVVTGQKIANDIVLLSLTGKSATSKIKGTPSTILHSEDNMQISLPNKDNGCFYTLTDLLDNNGNPVYLECLNQ